MTEWNLKGFDRETTWFSSVPLGEYKDVFEKIMTLSFPVFSHFSMWE